MKMRTMGSTIGMGVMLSMYLVTMATAEPLRCLNDTIEKQLALAPMAPMGPYPRYTSGVSKSIPFLMETDTELRALFASLADEQTYLLNLANAVRTVYVGTDAIVTIKQVNTYETTDPWTATTVGGALDEVRAAWPDSARANIGVQGVIFVSGKTSLGGGVAYVNVLCTSYPFAVSQVYGSLTMDAHNYNYDIDTVAHEIGHVVGSIHTHCYNPPIDHCWNTETTSPNCYSGPLDQVVQGTIMSYCAITLAAESQLVLHATVQANMNNIVANRSCLANAVQCCGCDGCHPC